MGIHNTIKLEYEKRRRNAWDELESRRQAILSAAPELQAIEDEIRASGIKYNKMILLGSSPEQTAVSELMAGIYLLKQKKERLLKERGFSPSDLEPAYQCDKCSDTGFVSTEEGEVRCTCYKQLQIRLLYTQSNLKLIDTENFSRFDEALYPDTVNEARYGIRKSPRENIRYIREKCLGFIENFQSTDEKNLFFCGPTGVGKTFMTNCIAAEILNRGRTVLYQTAPLLFDALAANKRRNSWNEDFEDDAYRNIFETELLIIDDLGTESPSPARYAELLNLLNTRQANNLTRPCKTIISTNIEVDKLHEYYTERVASRVIGCFALFRFAGEDIRPMKKQGLR